MSGLTLLRRSPRLAIAIGLAVMCVAATAAFAATHPANLSYTPRTEGQITNIDVLRQWISNYYGDPQKTGVFAPDSNYAKEAMSVADKGGHWLASQAKKHGKKSSGMKAIVLDVDDTTLTTWNYEIFSNWDYDPGTNGTFVTNQEFPATPGMVDMVNKAADEGYAIFFLTGRPATQEAATLGNLTVDGVGVDAGYPQPTTLVDGEDGLFTKPAVADYPPYLQAACATEISAGHSCTTIHYKSATRQHIESLGYDIVASFGDQFSDLEGGYADKTFKMPNPNYYLP
jgi:predicted secreted acid phosphatase